MSVWQTLREQLDPKLLKPQLSPEVLVVEQSPAGRGQVYMLRSSAGSYLRLTPREFDVVRLMTGERTVKEIAMEYFLTHRTMALSLVLSLVQILHARGFLTSKPVPTYELVRQRLRAGSLSARAEQVLNFLMRSEIGVSHLDPFVTAVYRAVGWLVLSPPVLALLAVVIVAGFFSFLFGERGGAPNLAALFGGGMGFLTVLVVPVFYAVLIVFHEMAHALVCKHFGREVPRGGFTMFFGFPAFFVDTSDIWMENRWRRIAVSAAGSLSDMAVAGALSLSALVLPTELGQVALLLATVAYFDIALNLLPLLELDGYYVLVDLLEMPMLRARAFRFVRTDLWLRLWQRQGLSRDEWILAAYGLVAGIFSIVFFIRALQYFGVQVAGLFESMITAGNYLLLPSLLALVVAVGVPMGLRLWHMGRQAAHTARRGVRSAATAAEHARLQGRVSLLRGVPVLTELPPAQLDTIAAAMRGRRYPVGAAVVRQGERGDRFFLILRGQAEVLQAAPRAGPGGMAGVVAERVGVLGDGDYFGELALLHQSPRAASVRALTALDVFELSADDFARLVSPTWQLKERMQQALALRDAAADIELFQGLRPTERDLLLSKLVEESYAAGATIIRQGDLGDRFYVVREGQVKVVERSGEAEERHVAELGPGAYFGELALLLSAPRTVTVRALTAVQVWSLGQRDFDELLVRFLRLGESFDTVGRERLRALGHPRATAVM